MKITRRKFLVLLGAAAVAALAGGVFYRALVPSRRQLRVYNYSEYIDKSVIKEFEKAYGVEVIYDEYEATEEAFAKLQLGGGGYDVIILTDAYVPQAIREGLIRPLDHTLIPNLANLDPLFVKNPFDPGLKYAVPYMWGTTGIGYNSKYVKEGEIDGYEDLFDTQGFLPRHKGKVTMLEEFVEVINAAKLYLKIPLDDWSDKAVEKIIELLRAQKPYLAGYVGASIYIRGLVEGTIHAAQAWNGDVLMAQDEEPAVRYVVPKEGATTWIDFMVIPAKAREVELAHAWINFMLDPKIAARNTSAVYYANPLKLSLVEDLLPEEILENPAIYPPPELRVFSLLITS